MCVENIKDNQIFYYYKIKSHLSKNLRLECVPFEYFRGRISYMLSKQSMAYLSHAILETIWDIANSYTECGVPKRLAPQIKQIDPKPHLKPNLWIYPQNPKEPFCYKATKKKYIDVMGLALFEVIVSEQFLAFIKQKEILFRTQITPDRTAYIENKYKQHELIEYLTAQTQKKGEDFDVYIDKWAKRLLA
jgi:hypothetical protein